jgi:hypothetical protein
LEGTELCIPETYGQFEKRFIMDNIESLVRFLEEELELRDADYRTKNFMGQFQKLHIENRKSHCLN